MYAIRPRAPSDPSRSLAVRMLASPGGRPTSIRRNTNPLHGPRRDARPPSGPEDGGDQGPRGERGRPLASPQPRPSRGPRSRLDLPPRGSEDRQGPAGTGREGPSHPHDSGGGRRVPAVL